MVEDASWFRSQRLLDRERSALLVVDIQQRLAPHIVDHRRLVWNAVRLVRGAGELGVSVEGTEQYPKGLGETVDELADLVPQRHEKMSFSAAAIRPLVTSMADRGITQIAICGMETHVCILQSGLDLAAEGFDLFIVTDAVGSRDIEDHAVALERMRDEGLSMVTTETVLFEWCRTAADPAFQAVRKLVQDAQPGRPTDVGFGRR